MYWQLEKPETPYDKYWNVKGEYGQERVRRKNARKEKRTLRRKEIKEQKDKYYCRGCGEDPYCYCGDGTPYSY